SGSGGSSGGGHAVVTVGDETWELDRVTCAFGEAETGIEGAEVNLSAGDGELSLYLALEPDGTYIEFGDPTGEEGSIQYTTLGGDDPEIEIDGRSVNARAQFLSYDDSGSADDPVDATVRVTCPGGDVDNTDATGNTNSTDSSDGEASGGSGASDSDSSDRVFDVSRESLAKSLVIGTSADDYKVDGDTIRLIFKDGSKDSVSAVIACSASMQLKGENDRIEVTYPDGTADCAELVPALG